jgi:hypothetical protein
VTEYWKIDEKKILTSGTKDSMDFLVLFSEYSMIEEDLQLGLGKLQVN